MQYEESISIAASPEKIFDIYSDVAQWSLWDDDVESSSLNGGFTVGSVGLIKPKGSPKSKITLIQVTDNQSFTIECGLPLCKMQFIHWLESKGNNTKVVNQVKFSGFLAPLFVRLIGKEIARTLPNSLAGLKKFTESKS